MEKIGKIHGVGIRSHKSTDIDSIRVLHVDDEQDVAEIATTFLEKENNRIETLIANDAHEGMDILSTNEIDCIVSDFDMPGPNGIEFLKNVRNSEPDLPFILFTGKGSEEVASEAISAGVTDYMQKETGTDQYAVLANRIVNSVSHYHTQRVAEQAQQRFQTLIEYSTDVISIVDEAGQWQFLTPSSKRILGYSPAELIGDIGFDYVHPDDTQNALEKFNQAIENPDTIPSIEFRFEHPEKGWIWVNNRARNMIEDPLINGFIVHTRNITQRKEQSQQLQRENERLDEFARTIAHDLRNPLNIIQARLELAREDYSSEHHTHIESAIQRMDELIDRTLHLAQSGNSIGKKEPIELGRISEQAWGNVDTKNATVRVADTLEFTADEERTIVFLENIFRNAIQHGGDDVTVSVGTLPNGFFVEDDGTGIPDSIVGSVFESGISTGEDGIGLGLTICNRIAEAHSWEVRYTESKAGGARIEVTGVEME